MVRAALSLVLRFLERRDVTRLVVATLDTNHIAVALWLIYSDVYPLRIDEIQCLNVAVAERCWTAAIILLKKVAHDQGGQIPTTSVDGSLFDMVVALHRSVEYVFPPSVMYLAALQGDLQQIVWLHTTTQYTTMEAVRHAAEAKHLGVVQWLLDHIQTGERLQCWLRYEDAPVDVRAIGWICQTDDQVHFCALSEAHGSTQRTENLWDPNARIPDLPLTEPFAAIGDQASLETLYKQFSNDSRLFSRFTIVHAAAGGYLNAVKWLHSLAIHQWPLTDAMIKAAGKGYLDVVQWLDQFPDTRNANVTIAAVEGGHMHVADWLRQDDLPTHEASDHALWSAAAKSRKLSVYRHLYGQWGLRLESSSALFMGIAGDRPLMEYVVGDLLPDDHDCETLVFDAAKKGTLDSLVYLVDVKDAWSRKTLRAALTRPSDSLEFVQWIHHAAKKRSIRANEPLDKQLDFSDIHVFIVAREAGLDTALWLLENIPEVSTHTFHGLDAFHPEVFAHTCVDVLAGDLGMSKQSSQAAGVDALLIACLKYRSHLCITIDWLPEWAVRANSIQGFDLLEQCEHPNLITEATRNCIIAFSRHGYFMNKLLAYDTSLDSPSARDWARQYRLEVHLPSLQ